MDDELTIDGGGPVLIPPGDYDAQVLNIRKITKFNRLMYQMRFQIVSMDPFNGTVLEAWLPFPDGGKLAKGSKLVRWYLALEEWGRKDRVSLKAFRGRLLRVTVRTVERDYRQKLLPKSSRYSVVDEVVETVALLQSNAGERRTA